LDFSSIRGTELIACDEFDVLLAADIVACPYVGAFDDLLLSFQQIIQPKTIAYLAYKQRHASEVKFFHKLKKQFLCEEIPREHLHIDFQHLGIQLFQIKCK